MAGFIVDNNVESTVADSPLAQSAVTLNVANGEGANFPSTFPYRLTIWDETTYQDSTDDSGMEIVECTARTADALTIVRAKEGTADVAHANGERVALLITAGLFNDASRGVITKLDTIEDSATADQTDTEIRNAVEAAADSNTFKDADHTKLNGVEDNATIDQTGPEIKTLYEAQANAYTDTKNTKLAGIEDNATADQTNTEIRDAVEAAADSNTFKDADHTKLNGVDSGATDDQTGAEIKTAYEGEANTNAYDDAAVTRLAGIEAGADITDATNVAAAGAVMRTSENITISGGAVTPTGTHHVRLETQDGAGTDNLDHVFLTNYNVGDLITFSDQNSTHDVTIRDNSIGGGAIYTRGHANFALIGTRHSILFVVVDIAGTKTLIELTRTGESGVTRYMFLGSPHHHSGVANDYGIKLVNANDDFAWYQFHTPTDFVSLTGVYALYYGTVGDGNAHMSYYAKYGTTGEAPLLHAESDTNNIAAIATTNIKYTCAGLLASIALEDHGYLIVRRQGGDGDDTDTGDVIFQGFLIAYIADK